MADVLDKERLGLDPKLGQLLQEDKDERKDYIHCAACSHVITRLSDRMEMNGRHEHYCVNPYGLEFHIGCFREALGCALSGSPQAADSWFLGFQWRLATCAECRRHLGWYFDRPGDGFFYGLILDRIQHDKE